MRHVIAPPSEPREEAVLARDADRRRAVRREVPAAAPVGAARGARRAAAEGFRARRGGEAAAGHVRRGGGGVAAQQRGATHARYPKETVAPRLMDQ